MFSVICKIGTGNLEKNKKVNYEQKIKILDFHKQQNKFNFLLKMSQIEKLVYNLFTNDVYRKKHGCSVLQEGSIKNLELWFYCIKLYAINGIRHIEVDVICYRFLQY